MANFVFTPFNNLNLYILSSMMKETDILSSTKEEMDARKGNFSFVTKNKKKELPKIFFIDLDVYRRNGTEEQNCKESLQAISSVIQVSFKGLAFFYV